MNTPISDEPPARGDPGIVWGFWQLPKSLTIYWLYVSLALFVPYTNLIRGQGLSVQRLMFFGPLTFILLGTLYAGHQYARRATELGPADSSGLEELGLGLGISFLLLLSQFAYAMAIFLLFAIPGALRLS